MERGRKIGMLELRDLGVLGLFSFSADMRKCVARLARDSEDAINEAKDADMAPRRDDRAGLEWVSLPPLHAVSVHDLGQALQKLARRALACA